MRLVNYGLGFVASVVISRALLPAGRGQYYLIITIALTALAVAHLSLEQTNWYLWRRTRAHASLVTNSTIMALLQGSAVALLFSVGWVTGLHTVLPVAQPIALFIALVCVPFAAWAASCNGLLVAQGRMWEVNRATLVGAGVQGVLLIALAVTGNLTVTRVVVIWGLTFALPVAVQLPGLLRRPGFGRPDFRLARQALRFACRYHVGTLAGFLLLRIDVFMLARLTDHAEVGIYSLAVALGESAVLMTSAIATTAVARQIEAPTDAMVDASYTAQVSRINLLFGGVIVALVCISSPVLIPVVFGQAFSPSIYPLLVLAPGIVALALRFTLEVFVVQQDKPLLVSLIGLSSLGVNVVLNLALIPLWGAVGAAAASSISYGLLVLLYVVWFLAASAEPISVFWPRLRELAGPLNAIRGDISRLKASRRKLRG